MRGIEVLNNASYDNAQSELNHDMNTMRVCMIRALSMITAVSVQLLILMA